MKHSSCRSLVVGAFVSATLALTAFGLIPRQSAGVGAAGGKQKEHSMKTRRLDVVPPWKTISEKAAPVEITHCELRFSAGNAPELLLWRKPGHWIRLKTAPVDVITFVQRAVANPKQYRVLAYENNGTASVRIITKTGLEVLDSLQLPSGSHPHVFWTREQVKAAKQFRTNPHVRPNLARLLDPQRVAEWNRYKDAFQRLLDDGTVGQFVAIHRKYRNEIHHVREFLPWHRLMLYKFEQKLQEIDPRAAIPYWDFAADGFIPPQFADWKPLVVFQDLDTGQTISHQVVRNTSIADHPTPSGVADLLKQTMQFDDFWQIWEGPNMSFPTPQNPMPTHDDIHVYLGRTMQTPLTAVADPIFWVFHSNIDNVWWKWQQQQADYPTTGALTPWPETAADVQDTQKQLNYVYEQ